MIRFFLYIILLVQSIIGFAQKDSSSFIRINKILIEGNIKTKPQIITRELSFEQGSQYTYFQLDSMFEWDGNRIYNTNLFNEVHFSLENTTNEETDVIITVDERWYFYPSPIFRLIDRNFNDWWNNRNRDLSRVNIGIKVTQYNFRGRAEKLSASAQFGFTTRLNFNYRIPYIEKTQRHGLEVDFSYLETKNLAYDTENNVRTFLESEELLRTVFRNRIVHSYRSSFYSFHFFNFLQSSVHIADTITSLNPNYLKGGATTQKYLSLGYSYAWDKRSNRNYPLSGEWYTVGIQKYGLGVYEDVDFWASEFRLTKYYDLGKNWYYAGNISGVLSFPSDRSYFNYFAIGFQRNILRGYDLTIVEGSNYFIQKNEIKKKLFSYTQNLKKVMPIRQFQKFPISLYGKFFFDQGFAKSYPNHDGSGLLDDQYLYSYGLGLDIVTLYDSVFRLELSRNTLDETNFFINFGTTF